MRAIFIGCFVLASGDATATAGRPEHAMLQTCLKPLPPGKTAREAGGYPVWSPDGQWIAFNSYREEVNVDLYLIRPDGSGIARVTDHPAIDAHPNWSPDSGWLLFDSTREGNREGYVVSRDGCVEQRLTRHPKTDITFDWKPGASAILFSSDRNGVDHLYTAPVARSKAGMWEVGDPVQLTTQGSRNGAAAWNPKGAVILFESRRDGNRELYTINSDGTGERNITNNPAQDNFGRWSPDGKRIAFWSDRNGNDDLFVMQADGGEVRQLTFDPAKDRMPSWSPDGRSLVFASERTGRNELYLLDLASLATRQLTCGGLAPCR